MTQLIINNIARNNEYQLSAVLYALSQKGFKFVPEEIDGWPECGNKEAVIIADKEILDDEADRLNDRNFNMENTIFIEPCYFGEKVVFKNSVIGTHLSVGENTYIDHAFIKNSIIQHEAKVTGYYLNNPIIGNFVELQNNAANYKCRRL